MRFTIDANTDKGCCCILIYCHIPWICWWHSCWNHFLKNRHCTITNTQVTQIIYCPIICSQWIWPLRGWRWSCYSPQYWWLRRGRNSIWRKKQHASIIVMTMPKHKTQQMLACILQRLKKRIKKLTTMNKARKLIITMAQERDTENSHIHNHIAGGVNNQWWKKEKITEKFNRILDSRLK